MFFEDACGEHGAAAVVVQSDGKGQDAPGVLLLVRSGFVEQAAMAPVDVGFAGEGYGLDDVAPVSRESGELLLEAAADEPVAGLAEVFGCGVVAVLPDALFVEDLNQDVRADGHGDAGVKEVAGVDHDGSATAFCFKRAERVEEIFDGAVAFEEMHVLDAAKVLVEGSGEDDDGDMRAASADERGDLGAELACAEMVVEDSYVDVVREFSGLFDAGGGDALIAALAEDGGAEVKIDGFVVEQEDADGLDIGGLHLKRVVRSNFRRLKHGFPQL